jgi:hypothetical protein
MGTRGAATDIFCRESSTLATETRIIGASITLLTHNWNIFGGWFYLFELFIDSNNPSPRYYHLNFIVMLPRRGTKGAPSVISKQSGAFVNPAMSIVGVLK